MDKQITEGIHPELQPRMLSIVSVDNIDILQPYAFVSSLDSSRSWHGTSVQCVQPLPVSGHLTPDDMHVSQAPTRKHPLSSPVSTPVPVLKSKRRRRTLAEQSSPHTTINPPDHQRPFESLDLSEYGHTQTILSLQQFKPNSSEQNSLDILQEDLFKAVCLRYFKSNDSNQPFPGLQSLLNCVRKQAADAEVSNVVYVEIISQRADSKSTVMGVIGRLQKTFVCEFNQKYVIVVGDAKTYNILKEISFEYRSELKWLIPWPGDWHVLFNYQKVLMKPYADAGLASLGKASGHRSETLTALIQASNFRKTHEFLFQSFEAFYRYFLSLYITHLCNGESENTPTTIKEEIKH